MKEVSATGGARIGWVNATWPLAKLAASAMRLRLASVLGTYDFLPIDVVSLERYGSIPFFYSGIRIVHARPDYPAKIIFWCFGNPEGLIEEIHETGFLPTAPATSEIKWRGIPVCWTTILFLSLFGMDCSSSIALSHVGSWTGPDYSRWFRFSWHSRFAGEPKCPPDFKR